MINIACESFGLIVVNMRTPECIKDNLQYKLTRHVSYDEYGTGRLQNKNGEFKCGWGLPRPAEYVKIGNPLHPYRLRDLALPRQRKIQAAWGV